MCSRGGYSLIEAVTALSLSGLLMAVIGGICMGQMRLARAAAQQAETAETIRTVTAVMSGEARRMTAGDVAAAGADSVALRAFRGSGIVCGSLAARVLVRYTGDRMPDPAKDSIIVLLHGAETPAALHGSTPAPDACAAAPAEEVFAFDTSEPVPVGALVLLFERGTYHLADRAFRYRVGDGGRQPLTTESLRHPGSRFDSLASGGIRLTLDAGGRVSRHAAVFTRTIQP